MGAPVVLLSSVGRVDREMKLGIAFGGMAKPIREQLRDQGMTAAKQLLDQWERDAGAITRLAIRCVLSESEVSRARRRLLKDILHGTVPTPDRGSE